MWVTEVKILDTASRDSLKPDFYYSLIYFGTCQNSGHNIWLITSRNVEILRKQVILQEAYLHQWIETKHATTGNNYMVLLQLMPAPLNCSQCHEDVAESRRHTAILYKIPCKCFKQ